MKVFIKLLLVFGLLYISCKKQQKEITSENVSTIEVNKISNTKDTVLRQRKLQIQDTLSLENFDFKTMLSSMKYSKYTGNKHKDWMSDYSFVFSRLFELNSEKFKMKTTSYEYKQKCTFYLHTLKHVNDTISMMPYIKNTVNKKTEGYMKTRFLFLSMKDSLIANFIDIPEKMNPLELREELIEKIYERMDIEAIFCKYSDPCKLQDFGKLEGVNETN